MRYERRAASCGNVTLNSSRKNGNTLKYWYWIHMGQGRGGKERWLEFDVRDLAKVAGAELPQLISSDELSQLHSDEGYELLLHRDLHRVAAWCAGIDAVERLSTLAPKGKTWFLDDGFADAIKDHGVTDDDGNLLIGQRGDGSPIWDNPEEPLPLQRVAHFTENDARRKAWELSGAGYGPTGISQLHHSGIAGVLGTPEASAETRNNGGL
jgi:hypothetical protein